jgi:hypothetical protein
MQQFNARRNIASRRLPTRPNRQDDDWHPIVCLLMEFMARICARGIDLDQIDPERLSWINGRGQA